MVRKNLSGAAKQAEKYKRRDGANSTGEEVYSFYIDSPGHRGTGPPATIVDGVYTTRARPSAKLRDPGYTLELRSGHIHG
jgi:hypothetical protein